MALQNYTPMRLATGIDQGLRHELLKVDIFLRQLTPFAARVPVFPQGTTASSVDLTQFLFLPGRSPRQRAYGNVTFSAGTVDQGTALDDSVLRGFVLEGGAQTAGAPVTHSVYFQPDNATSTTIVRKWIFPSISSSPTDTFTFAATTGNQTFSGKIITTSQIYVGTAASKNTFVDSNNTDHTFTIGIGNGFPLTSTQLSPQLRLPALNTSVPLTDRHTFMMLNASIPSPFVTGSIAHGNHDGSEMQMLPAGGNGRALRFNVGETVAATTWTNGGTTILGTFDITKTRPGMRVRGNSGTNVYVDENTMIVTVSGTQITVDTPLVGNNVATVTVQTWGPTWDTDLPGIDHGSLGGLTDDDHPQYLYLTGRGGGQVLGSGVHTSGDTASLAIEGRMMIGDGLFGINYSAGRALDVRGQLANNSTLFFLQNTTGLPGGAASGTLRLMLIQPLDVGYSSGSFTFQGMSFLSTGVLAPIGVICTVATAINVQATPSEGGDPGSGGTFGVISSIRGMALDARSTVAPAQRVILVTTNGTTAITSAGLFVAPIAAGQLVGKSDVPARTTLASITDASNAVLSQAASGSSTSSTGFTPLGTDLIALRIQASARAKPLPLASMIHLADGGGGNTYIVDANLLEVNATVPFNSTGVGTWSLIKMPTTVSNPVTATWIFNISAVNNSRHAGMFSIGSAATPTRWVDLGAGTTSIGPLGFASGTNKTTAASGDVEYDGSYWYLTHSDAVRTTNVTQRGVVNATAQAAAIGVTTLYTPPAAGYYVVHYTLEDTTADVTAGTIQFQVNYTDDIGATNQTGAALAMTATGRDRGSFQIWSNSGVISYQTNLVGIFGTARYALRVRLESLG